MYFHVLQADGLVPEVSAEARQLGALLLNPDAEARMSVAAALKHPWLQRPVLPQHAAAVDRLAREQRMRVASGQSASRRCAANQPGKPTWPGSCSNRPNM